MITDDKQRVTTENIELVTKKLERKKYMKFTSNFISKYKLEVSKLEINLNIFSSLITANNSTFSSSANDESYNRRLAEEDARP